MGDPAPTEYTEILPTAADLVYVHRQAVVLEGNRILGIHLYFSPVGEDVPVYHLALLADPDAALTNHFMSQEQHDALMAYETPNSTPDQETQAHG